MLVCVGLLLGPVRMFVALCPAQSLVTFSAHEKAAEGSFGYGGKGRDSCVAAGPAVAGCNVVELRDFPPCSPDINAIEAVWGWLKRRVAASRARTAVELKL